MRPGTLLIGAAAAALVAVAVPQPTLAQTYPTQDVHFICAFAAGSGADIIVRYFSEKMRPLMGRSIIVENRVGAIGISRLNMWRAPSPTDT
jgi:tripartite-type tricarboxylate transporter receptor subunit TctC